MDSLLSNEDELNASTTKKLIQLNATKIDIMDNDDHRESQSSSIIQKSISSFRNLFSHGRENRKSIDNTKMIEESVKIKELVVEPVLKIRSSVLIWEADNRDLCKIIYPECINMDHERIYQSFKLLAQYRNIIQQQNKVDFVNEPFKLGAESTETMLIVLNMLVESFGHRMYFVHTPFIEEDDAYRSACGIVDLATFFYIINRDKSLLTAKFNFTLAGSYDEVTTNRKSIKDFVLAFVSDLAKLLECPSDYICVLDIESGSIKITFGVQANNNDRTQALADTIQQHARRGFDRNHFPVLHRVYPRDYSYEMKPALVHLQITPNDFQLDFNRDFTEWPRNESIERRGNRNYYLPLGWYRHALNVGKKYGLDNAWWLDMWNGPDEWLVAYHGTKDFTVRNIVDNGFHAGGRDVYKDEAIAQVGEQANVKGIYLATHCGGDGGASIYADQFPVPLPAGESMSTEHYQIVFQCRVKPGSFTEHNRPEQDNLQWLRVFQTDAIRPYGILLHKVIPHSYY